MDAADKFFVGLACIVLLVSIMVALIWLDSRIDNLECQEDMACWNCEEMGNKKCG